MKKFLLAILLSCSAAFCYAEVPMAIGGGAWEKKHADEPSVELLSDYRAGLAGDGSYTEYIHRKTLVQNELGMADEGELVIPYNRKYQVVKKIKAVLTDPQGKKHAPKMIQDADTVTEGYYSDIRKKIITMPNVVPGSVIDFEFEVYNKQNTIKGEYFLSLELFSAVPYKYRRVTLIAPEGKTIYFKVTHTDRKPVIKRRNGRVSYVWEMKDDDGYDAEISKEAFTPPPIDFLPHVFVSTMKDWSSFSDWYQKVFSKNVVVSAGIREAVATITKDQLTVEDKIESLAKYMTDNFRYVAISLNAHNFEPHPSDEVFRNKFGDCKDQSVLFVAMLKVLGIESFPVLVRDASLGDFRQLLPDPSCFNHVIVAVKIDGTAYFVDPLVEGYRVNELPLHLEGDYVLIVNGSGGGALRLPFADIRQKTSITRSVIQMDADGSAVDELALTFDRQDSIDKRRVLKLQTDEDKKSFLEYLENLTQGGKVLEYTIEGQDDIYGFLTIKVKTQNPQMTKPRGPFLIFGDTGFDFTSSFPEKERKYPLWFDAETLDVKISDYRIPENFVFEYVPPSVDLTSEVLDIKVLYTMIEHGIRQEIRQHIKRAFIPAGQYKKFKELLFRAERALDECIIIRKKNT